MQAQQCSIVWPLQELIADQLSEFGITEFINPMGENADNPKQR